MTAYAFQVFPIRSPLLPISNRNNRELVQRFAEWLVAQRFSRSCYQTYTKTAFALCHFLGKRDLSSVGHMDIRMFLIDRMRRDLSANGYNRRLYALRDILPLRRLFDFLHIGGVVDEVALQRG